MDFKIPYELIVNSFFYERQLNGFLFCPVSALKYVYRLPDVVYLQKNNSVGWTPVHYAAYEGKTKKEK
jgi:hypothetical protein